MKSDPTVFIVDDDLDFRRSTQWLLKRSGLRAETFSSAEEFLKDCDPATPGCVLLDVRMPGMSGLELQQRMAAENWCSPVIIVSGHADVPMAVRAMEAGAAGFVEKPFSRQVLLDHVRHALQQDAEARRQRSLRAEVEASFATLTAREREVMELIVGGRTTKEISRLLGASAKTIEIHRARVMKKMGVESIARLVVFAVQYGLCDPNHVGRG